VDGSRGFENNALIRMGVGSGVGAPVGLESRRLKASVYKAEPPYVEVTVDSSWPTPNASPDELEDLADLYFDKYQSAVRMITSRLGEPVFDDGAAAPGFPSDQPAEWLALWNCKAARLMLEQKHEDRELPFRLVIVLTARSA